MDEQQEILEICGGWAKQKLDLFSDWCFDELWAESFVCAHKIMHTVYFISSQTKCRQCNQMDLLDLCCIQF